MSKIIFLIFITISILQAQSIYVKYRGYVSTDTIITQNIANSSLVYDIKYNAKYSYLLVNLKGIYYHYCQIPQSKVNAWINSSSLGEYYLNNIKGNYDCRYNAMPTDKQLIR